MSRTTETWFTEYLPTALLAASPVGLAWWQLLAAPLLLLLALLVGTLASKVVRFMFGRIVARTENTWDDLVLERLSAPLNAACTLGAIYLLIPLAAFAAQVETAVTRGLRAGFFLVFFWSLLRLVDVAVGSISSGPWAKTHSASLALVPLAGRVVKVLVVGMALVAVLSELGYPVASLVAGLGIGGLALALAGQKTVENLFGAFSIGIDQPFRQGDYVRVEGVEGTVEVIGLRSTRIRTPDRTLITLPNGKLAEMRIETFGARDRIRLACTIGLAYATSATQMRAVLSGIEALLRAHPKIWPDNVSVRFVAFGETALNLEILAWFCTSDWNEFQSIRQDLLLAIMETVEKAGSCIALPMQIVELRDTRAAARS